MKSPKRICVLLGIAACAFNASARPANEIETIYYATKEKRPGEEVGKTVLHCSGPFEREGTTSAFYVRYTYPCNQRAVCFADGEEANCSSDLCSRMKGSAACMGPVRP
jgi:hypothetical protein